MWKQKLGFSLGNNYSVSSPEALRMLAAAGFDAVSPEWRPDFDIKGIARAAADSGIALQSLHAPFGDISLLWNSDASAAQNVLLTLYKSIECCAEWNIPVCVCHTWIGFGKNSGPTSCGLASFEKLVEKAEKHGIGIAFENTEGEEFLFSLMEHFKGEKNVGFCWDSGHEMCYNHSKDLLSLYGDRLMMTHLNDNLGISRFDGETFWTDDLHLLPFDGIADWDYNAERLSCASEQEYLNFELTTVSKPNRHENDTYAQMSLECYFAECYNRACRVAAKVTAAKSKKIF